MQHHTETIWDKGYHFVSKLDEQEVHFDATALPGDHEGVSPKKMLLSSLAGCTGMDMIALLTKKYKVPFEQLHISVRGELTDQLPKYYHHIHMEYSIKVAPEHEQQVEEAVQRSLEKYCGVYVMLAKAAEMTHKITFL